MLISLRTHLRRHHASHLAGVQLGLVAAASLALTLSSIQAGPAQAHLRAGAALAMRHAPAGLTTASAVTPDPTPAGEAAPPVIRLQDLTPEAARLWNAANPISTLPNPPAKPFHLEAEGVLDEARAVDCMTAAIYYEAGNESLDGQRAVAQVVLNRLRHPAFPKTVCGVVFEGADRGVGCQFTFTCDGALARTPAAESWGRARQVAEAALHGYVMKKVGEATHYHAVYVAPYWSPTLVKVADIGAHIFYRWTGGAGRPPAFDGRYAGGEMQGVQMATLDDLARKSATATGARLAASVAPSTQVVAPEPAPPVEQPAPVAAAEADIVTPAAAVARDAQAIVPAKDLDWQGRPKPRQPPRLAMPSSGMGY